MNVDSIVMCMLVDEKAMENPAFVAIHYLPRRYL